MVELSIVIPFYNEEKNAKKVIEDIVVCMEKNLISYEIIGVDNGSIDKTGEILREVSINNHNIKAVNISKNIGYGFGISSGLKEAKGRYIGFIWGDNQLPAESIIKVFEKLKRENLDFCKTERIKRYDGKFRKIQSFFYNNLVSILFFKKLRDINGCPKIMKTEVYKNLNIESNDWFIDCEIVLKACKNNYKIGSVPIIFEKRKEGKSNVGLFTAFEFLKNIIKYRLK